MSLAGIWNIHWIALEIFLGFSTLCILAYGVIYTKKAGIISQLRSLSNLAIITLVICLSIILSQFSLISSPIDVGFLSIDTFNSLIKAAITIFGILLISISKDKSLDYEYIVLYLLSILGMYLLVSSNDLLMMYLSIETISLSLYILAALNKSYEGSAESGLKYFILGALSSGILIAGCVIIYMITGETSINNIGIYLWHQGEGATGVEIGVILVIISLLFKLGAAPFHMWVPDVYEGAPTFVTAYFAILPKISTIGFLYKFWWAAGWNTQELLIWCGITSIIVGSIGAINQTKLKRLLAYSAIAHMGFMLIGLGAGTMESVVSTFIYMGIYMIMSLNTFAIILNKGYNYVSELSGLSRKEPVLALTLGLGFLSVAGIPPLAGFYSKYAVLLAAVEGGLTVVSLIAVLASVIGGFYYVRIVKWIYFNDSKDYLYNNIGEVIRKEKKMNGSNAIIIGVTYYLILSLWIYPTPLIEIFFTGLMTGSLV